MIFRIWFFMTIFFGMIVLLIEAWKNMFWLRYEFNEVLKKIQKTFLILFVINFFLILTILIFFAIFFY